jgi:hypothetical protein
LYNTAHHKCGGIYRCMSESQASVAWWGLSIVDTSGLAGQMWGVPVWGASARFWCGRSRGGLGGGVRDPSSFGMSRAPRLSWLARRIPILADPPDMTPSEAPCLSPQTPRLGRSAALSRGQRFWGISFISGGRALLVASRQHCLALFGRRRRPTSHERQGCSAEGKRGTVWTRNQGAT